MRGRSFDAIDEQIGGGGGEGALVLLKGESMESLFVFSLKGVNDEIPRPSFLQRERERGNQLRCEAEHPM